MKRRISYTVPKSPITALIGGKYRTFYLTPPSRGTVEFLMGETRIREVAEGKQIPDKRELAKIVAAGTLNGNFRSVIKIFAWYLEKRLSLEVLSQLSQIIATLISPEEYRRPLSLQTVFFISTFPYK